jgi:hypothetical protein
MKTLPKEIQALERVCSYSALVEGNAFDSDEYNRGNLVDFIVDTVWKINDMTNKNVYIFICSEPNKIEKKVKNERTANTSKSNKE